MITGIGIDLVSVERMREKIKNQAFVEKVFSKKEIQYCNSTAKSAQHFAVRFAAKEAFLKATGKGLSESFDLRNVEIEKDEREKPFIRLHGEFYKMEEEEGWQSTHVSLSHEGDNAIAIVIIER